MVLAESRFFEKPGRKKDPIQILENSNVSRPEQRFQNGPPRTGNNQKIAGSGDGKRRQERITLEINRISDFVLSSLVCSSFVQLSRKIF